MASDAAADAAGAFFQAASAFDALLGRHEGEMAADAAEEAAAASRAAAEAAAAERAHYAGAAAEEEAADAADGDEEAAAEDAEQAFDADAGEAAAAAGAEEAAAAAGAEEAEEAAHEEAAAAAGAEEAEADVVLHIDIDSADEDGCADAALAAVSEPRDDSSGAAVSEAPISGGSAQSSGSAEPLTIELGVGRRVRQRTAEPPQSAPPAYASVEVAAASHAAYAGVLPLTSSSGGSARGLAPAYAGVPAPRPSSQVRPTVPSHVRPAGPAPSQGLRAPLVDSLAADRIAQWKAVYNNRYTPEQIADMRAESEVARSMGLSWAQRGPVGPDEGGPLTWRGQQFRVNSGVWANRGGKHRAYFAAKYGRGAFAPGTRPPASHPQVAPPQVRPKKMAPPPPPPAGGAATRAAARGRRPRRLRRRAPAAAAPRGRRPRRRARGPVDHGEAAAATAAPVRPRAALAARLRLPSAAAGPPSPAARGRLLAAAPIDRAGSWWRAHRASPSSAPSSAPLAPAECRPRPRLAPAARVLPSAAALAETSAAARGRFPSRRARAARIRDRARLVAGGHSIKGSIVVIVAVDGSLSKLNWLCQHVFLLETWTQKTADTWT